MTLKIALACTDGVVFASDGQETIETSGKPIRLPIQKIKANKTSHTKNKTSCNTKLMGSFRIFKHNSKN